MNQYIMLIGVSLVSMTVLTLNEPISFSYTYKVIGASNNIIDVKNAYLYKERLIDTYEDLVFDYSSNEHQKIIEDNLDKFRFDEHCYVHYNGTIILIIDQGLGYTLEGKLKKNVCDEETKNEKFYIFELFN